MISGKVALVLQGGGTRGVFTAGVTDAFYDAGLFFPCVLGTSSGCLVGYNVVSEDRGRAKQIVIQGMKGKEFGSYGNLISKGSFFNFDYLFNGITEKIPFSAERFAESKVLFYCGCTDVNDGLPKYFEKSDPNFNGYAAGSSSLPFLAKPVEVNGGLYMDGGTVCPIPFRKAIEDGYEKLVVVFTRARDYKKKAKRGFLEGMAFKTRYRKYPKYVDVLLDAGAIYNKDMDDLFALEKEGKAFLIFPRKTPEVGRKEKDEKKLEAFYQEGYEVATESIEAIKKFLGIEA